MKNIIPFGEHIPSRVHQIRKFGDRISREKMSFLEGKTLEDIDFYIEEGPTRGKVRRIVEKRVSQKLHSKWKRSGSNCHRFVERRRLSDQLQYLYGEDPKAAYFYAA